LATGKMEIKPERGQEKLGQGRDATVKKGDKVLFPIQLLIEYKKLNMMYIHLAL